MIVRTPFVPCVPSIRRTPRVGKGHLKNVSVPDIAQVISRARRMQEQEDRKQVQDEKQFEETLLDEGKAGVGRLRPPVPWQWVDSAAESSRFVNTVRA